MKVIKNVILFLLCIGVISCLLVFSKQVSASVQNSLSLCMNTIIPSLFCFMAVCSVIASSRLSSIFFLPFKRFVAFLYGVNRDEVPLVVLSIIGGYPTGAKLIADRVKSGELSRPNANRLLFFCVNSGPAFLISGISVPIFGNTVVGWVLFISHILSGIIIANITRTKRISHIARKKRPCYQSLPLSIITSAQTTASAMAVICALVIMFAAFVVLLNASGITDFISSLLRPLIPKEFTLALISGGLEICGGIGNIKSLVGSGIILASALTAFGGICVHTQIFAIAKKANLSLNQFFFYRIAHTFFSTLITLALIKVIPIPQTVGIILGENTSTGNGTLLSSIFLVLICGLLLLNLHKSDIISKVRFIAKKE